ncbi:MAG: endo-1,4-beta-xylanase [Nocardioides sp.]|nr:endo-1,4-beta-xylanase [Nocardioides sp.]
MTVAAAALAVTATVSIAGAGGAEAAQHGFKPPADSLRAYGDKVGLKIGNAINPTIIGDKDLSTIAADQYSVVTPENEMKWEKVEPTRGTYDWSGGDQVVAFAQAHGQKVRGHVLLWHSQVPAWLTNGVNDGTISNDELRGIVKKHVTDEVTHYKGKIWQWDVANEFFTDSNPSTINASDFWVQHLGAGIIGDVFRWAHAADPNALLFYNDYNDMGEDGNNAKFNAILAWAKDQRAHGVPIQGIGMQGHLDTRYGFSGARARADLQAVTDAGFKTAITEADVRTFTDAPATQVPTNNLEYFAQPYEFSQELQACLSVKGCISFSIWGIDDAHSWIPGVWSNEGYALIYDVNHQPKEAYTTLQTDLKLATGGAPRR